MRCGLLVAALCLCAVSAAGVSQRDAANRRGWDDSKLNRFKDLAANAKAATQPVSSAFDKALKTGENVLADAKDKIANVFNKPKTDADKAFEQAESQTDNTGGDKDAAPKADGEGAKATAAAEPQAVDDAKVAEPETTSTTTEKPAPIDGRTAEEKRKAAVEMLAESLNCTVHKDDLMWTLDDIKEKWESRLETFDRTCQQEQDDISASYETTRAAAEQAMNANVSSAKARAANATGEQQADMDAWAAVYTGRAAELKEALAGLKEERAALNETLATALRDHKVATEAKTQQTELATKTFAEQAAAKALEADEAMAEDKALLNETLGEAQKVLDDGVSICQGTHDEIVNLVNGNPYYKVKPQLDALNACRRMVTKRALEQVKKETREEAAEKVAEEAAGQEKAENRGADAKESAVEAKSKEEKATVAENTALLEIGAGCATEMLELQNAAHRHLSSEQAGLRGQRSNPVDFFKSVPSKIKEFFNKLTDKVAEKKSEAGKKIAELTAKLTATPASNASDANTETSGTARVNSTNVTDAGELAVEEMVKQMTPNETLAAVDAESEPEQKNATETKVDDKFYGPTEDDAGNMLTIPSAKVEVKLEAKKNAAAEELGKCTGTLEVAFDEKKLAAKKKFEEDTAPIRVDLEDYLSKKKEKRDNTILQARSVAMVTADGLKKANESLASKLEEIAVVNAKMQALSDKQDSERPVEQGKVDAIKAKGDAAVKAVAKKSKTIYDKKTKPLPALEKHEKEEAAAECADKRKDIVRDGKLIDDLTKAAKREVKEKKKDD